MQESLQSLQRFIFNKNKVFSCKHKCFYAVQFSKNVSKPYDFHQLPHIFISTLQSTPLIVRKGVQDVF